MKTFRVIIVSWCLVLAFTAAQSRSQPSDSSLSANPVFAENCAKCHGKNGGGRYFGGPSLISQRVASASEDDLRKIVSEGKGRMPKFAGKLTPEQIDEVIQQIKSLNKK